MDSCHWRNFQRNRLVIWPIKHCLRSYDLSCDVYLFTNFRSICINGKYNKCNNCNCIRCILGGCWERTLGWECYTNSNSNRRCVLCRQLVETCILYLEFCLFRDCDRRSCWNTHEATRDSITQLFLPHHYMELGPGWKSHSWIVSNWGPEDFCGRGAYKESEAHWESDS